MFGTGRLGKQGGIPPFRPSRLFRNSESGFWYDPSDLTSLYQDVQGTSPVTLVEQPVQLMLDKSQGAPYGVELVSNGTFDTDTAGWAAGNNGTLAVDTNRLRITNDGTGTNGGYASQLITTESGKTYTLSVDFTKGTATEGYLKVGTTIGTSGLGLVTMTATGTNLLTFTATGATTYVTVQNSVQASGTGFFDNISVRCISGEAYGPELVSNGTFDSNVDGWSILTGTEMELSWNAGKLRLSAPTGLTGTDRVGLPISGLETGKEYLLSADITKVAGTADVLVLLHNPFITTFPTFSDTGRLEFIFTPTSTTHEVRIQMQVGASSGTIYDFDNVSVKELAQNSIAVQTDSTKAPVLSSRYNLLEQTEKFDDAVWVKAFTAITADNTTAPDGTATADFSVPNSTSAVHYQFQTVQVPINKSITFSIYAKAENRDKIGLFFSSAQFPSSERHAWFNLTTGEVGGAETNVNASITDVGDGWYKCSISRAATTAASGNHGYYHTDGGFGDTITGNSVDGLYVWGADLRESQYDSLPYQRVGDASTTASDYDYSFNKFPPYLEFDGTDDYMEILNLSAASGPITAHFGVVSDDGESSAQQALFESETLLRSLELVTDVAGQAGYYDGAWTRVDIDTEALNVLTFNLNSTAGTIRANGTEVLLGTGEWTEGAISADVALGSNSQGTTYFLDGKLYQAMLRNVTSTTTEIEQAERYVNQAMGGGLL